MPKGKPSSAAIGRPTKLTLDLQERIVAKILKGNHPEVAARSEHVSSATFYEWIARGEGKHKDRGQTPETIAFAEAIGFARAQAEANFVERISDFSASQAHFVGEEANAYARAEETRLKAMQWMLERGFGQKWGAKAVVTDATGLTSPEDRPAVSIHYHTHAAPKADAPK